MRDSFVESPKGGRDQNSKFLQKNKSKLFDQLGEALHRQGQIFQAAYLSSMDVDVF